jgi:hypothetical protein
MSTGADLPLEWEPVGMGTKMSGASASVQRIAIHVVSLVLYLMVCIAASPRAIGQSSSGTIKSFHDDTLNITYFYSADFAPAPSSASVVPTDMPNCIKSTLFANPCYNRRSFLVRSLHH